VQSAPAINAILGSDLERDAVKNQSFARRLGYAIGGVVFALRRESSMRIHVAVAAGVLIGLALLRPAPLWWAVLILAAVCVMAAEMFNTAIEHLADHLSPEQHPSIRIVKDCAAAAVLLVSLGALGVGAAFVYSRLA
jgi:diacylglycerol kinase (ATP)